MALAYRIHPEADDEVADAAEYYADHASGEIAKAFVWEFEAARDEVIQAPRRWPIAERPEIRRCVLLRFPFAIYYRIEQDAEVVIYAVMHCSRQPGYWRQRLE